MKIVELVPRCNVVLTQYVGAASNVVKTLKIVFCSSRDGVLLNCKWKLAGKSLSLRCVDNFVKSYAS